MGALFSCSFGPSRPHPQIDLDAHLHTTSTACLPLRARLRSPRSVPNASLERALRPAHPTPALAVASVIQRHPWARMLAPSQLVEIHEVFSKFGARAAAMFPPFRGPDFRQCRAAVWGTSQRAGSRESALVTHAAATRATSTPSPALTLRLPFSADRDGDGHIEANELASVMRRLGLMTDADNVQQMLDAVDLDHNGKVGAAQEAREDLAQCGAAAAPTPASPTLPPPPHTTPPQIEFEEFVLQMSKRILEEDGKVCHAARLGRAQRSTPAR